MFFLFDADGCFLYAGKKKGRLTCLVVFHKAINSGSGIRHPDDFINSG